MSYHALPYTQYFLDTSCDYNHSGRPFREPQYQSLRYPCDGKLRHMLGLEHEVNYAFSYDPERDVIQIHFEKTAGFTDWVANFDYAADYYDAIGPEATKPYYKNDHTHTSRLGAERNAKSFAEGLRKMGHPLAKYLK